MKYSKFFGKTFSSLSSEIVIPSHKLLLKAGYIAESVAGRYYMLPLGMKVQNKMVSIIRNKMDQSGAMEMITPVLHPLELWSESGRDSATGFELTTITDRRGAVFALGGTAEEMFVDIVRRYNISYKDLPFNIYQFSTKFRDETRARGGLLRVREFLMKDAYAFTENEEQFTKLYQEMTEVYFDIYSSFGLKAKAVPAHNGFIGGDYCHEFVVDSQIGETKYLTTESSNYIAHEDVAKILIEDINSNDELLEIQEVEADRAKTIIAGSEFHNLPINLQIKNVAFKSTTLGLVLAVIRGDLDVNVTKLEQDILGLVEGDIEPLEDSEVIDLLGSYPGFISPVGIKECADSKGQKVTIVGDSSLRTIKNAYTGSNKRKVDLLNVNIDRDYTLDYEGDISLAVEGLKAQNGDILKVNKGIEVGNIFQNALHYTSKMKGADFTNSEGKLAPLYMGCFGIGIGRTLAAVVEVHNDDNGIIWPKNIAPYQIQLVNIGEDEFADSLYNELLDLGYEVLWDDRDVRPGVKFADCDLIGNPLRVVVSSRLKENNQFELKFRNSSDVEILSKEELLSKIQDFYAN